jgi:lipopolysaccharide transport system ATP-binding protein
MIRAEGLGKRYRLGLLNQRHNTLRDVFAGSARWLASRVRRRRDRAAGGVESTIWALRDVSFDLEAGEVLGVIGANGAGKSTLLKILSRITEPTEGVVELRGRVGSLLEVGTGFHSELTGRENTFLSGAILGMRRVEIERKFDEIVAFAEVERFIDTPVKHYSTGMYLRLAFAVAAHLEPDILIVDEVLAVGDASFQQKCLGKMGSAARGGRTVLFVSHNMEAVRGLCSRCIYLADGTIIDDGDPTRVVARYLSAARERVRSGEWSRLANVAPRYGSGPVRFIAARFSSGTPATSFAPYPFGPLELELVLESDQPRAVPSLAANVNTQGGLKLVNADTAATGTPVSLERGLNLVRLRIAELCLVPGIYSVGLWAADGVGQPYDHVPAAFDIEVAEGIDGHGASPPALVGLVPCRFEVTPAEPLADLPEAN